MDEANPTIISTTDAESVQGSSSDLAQNEIDVLKQELADVKEQLHSLAMMVENLTGVKVETVSWVSSWFSTLSPPLALDLLPLVSRSAFLSVDLPIITSTFRLITEDSLTNPCLPFYTFF